MNDSKTDPEKLPSNDATSRTKKPEDTPSSEGAKYILDYVHDAGGDTLDAAYEACKVLEVICEAHDIDLGIFARRLLKRWKPRTHTGE